jgi:hypothetical protein
VISTREQRKTEAEEPPMLVHDQGTMWALVKDRQEKMAADSDRTYRRGIFRRRPRRDAG